MRLIDADKLKDNCYIYDGDDLIGRREYITFYEIDEAPTIEPSDDVVNREKLIDMIVGTESKVAKNSPYDAEWFGRIADRQNEIIDIIREFPSVVRPRGEWIEVTNGRGGHECSNCHAYAPSYMSGDEYLSDFCPNCGADMRKE